MSTVNNLFPFLLMLSILGAGELHAKCTPKNFRGLPVTSNHDGVAEFLATREECPRDVLEFRVGLEKGGLRLQSTMISNQGYHYTSEGNFSFFEMALGRPTFGDEWKAGEVFFGHFTAPADGTLVLNQSPDPGNLMAELIAWDPSKGYYNFYELRGRGEKGDWFYRGDSKDILSDVRFLHRQPNPSEPQFGKTLRCSGCHVNGGPILKELASPHNDWWTKKRPLLLTGWALSGPVKTVLQKVVDADELSHAVGVGMEKLSASRAFREAKERLTLQEQLRPLFCPVEVNLESDTAPSDSGRPKIRVPSAFFVDPRLATGTVEVSREQYFAILDRLGSHFPNTRRSDGDHAWLAPVKAMSDIRVIGDAVSHGVVDEKFVLAVLSLDLTNPVASEKRCHLLRLVPEIATSDWKETFLWNLKASSDPSANELYSSLTDSGITAVSLQQKASHYIGACSQRLSDTGELEKMVRVLFQRRQEIFSNELSKNPLGQIFEPGFKVLFPLLPSASLPGQLRISADCRVE